MEKIKKTRKGEVRLCQGRCIDCGHLIRDFTETNGLEDEGIGKNYTPYQVYTCSHCGCIFKEIFQYSRTEKIG